MPVNVRPFVKAKPDHQSLRLVPNQSFHGGVITLFSPFWASFGLIFKDVTDGTVHVSVTGVVMSLQGGFFAGFVGRLLKRRFRAFMKTWLHRWVRQKLQKSPILIFLTRISWISTMDTFQECE